MINAIRLDSQLPQLNDVKWRHFAEINFQKQMDIFVVVCTNVSPVANQLHKQTKTKMNANHLFDSIFCSAVGHT